jgi:photosystem II stability/assembly factor-like uncharacterized protein
MKRIRIFLLLGLFSPLCLFAQHPTVQVLDSGTVTSIRGLSVVSNEVVWVSGSKGTIGRSLDGGQTWKWSVVKGFEKNDFRDIEAFDASTAIIMSVDAPAYILKTTNGGDTWKIVYESRAKGMFLDAMEFWNDKAGIVIGDPIDGKFFVARTFDGGQSWQEIPMDKRPVADSGEACFAASGTNIRVLDRDEAVFVTGGLRSRLFTRKPPVLLPMVQGKETTGANSVTVWNNRKMQGGQRLIVVGGDFNEPVSAVKNCYYSTDRGKTWKAPVTPPHGYRSCVEYISMQKAISCGLTGVDITYDGGRNWIWISKEGFHVCRKAKNGEAIFFAGNSGKIAKIVWE